MLSSVMESWRYGSEGKGSVLSDKMVSPSDTLARTRAVLTAWDLKNPCSYESAMLVSSRDSVHKKGLVTLGFMDGGRKLLTDNPIGGFSVGKIDNGSIVSPSCLVDPKVFSSDEESNSRISSLIIDSNSQDSSLVDLKLGRLADHSDAKNGKFSKEMRALSSIPSSLPAKKARSVSANALMPFCQVLGCHMDLSSSKDYHKRHKVCEIHSKTAKVIVNGIEQRFCQQCSRFHLLAEFDDGKRSCRKRLAGHNERRRKPQLDNRSEKSGRLLSYFHGTRFLGTPSPAQTSYICQDIFPTIAGDSLALRDTKFENNKWGRHVKSEAKAVYTSHTPVPIMNGHLFQRSVHPQYGMGKHCTPFHRVDTAPGSISYEENNRYAQDLTASQSISQSLFGNGPSGTEELLVLDTTTIQSLPRVSESGCALSLLSSQSQNSLTVPSGIPIAQPLFVRDGHAHFSMGQFPDKLLAETSQTTGSVASGRFSSSDINSVEDDQLGTVLVSDATDAINFKTQTDALFQGSDFINRRDPISREHGATVNLLQFSSQLQNRERQRHLVQANQDTGVFCRPITWSQNNASSGENTSSDLRN